MSEAPLDTSSADDLGIDLRADLKGPRPGVSAVDGLVLTPVSAVWPPRCVVCNRDTDDTDRVQFVTNVKIGYHTYQKVCLTLGVCDEHRQRRGIVLGTSGLALVAGGFIVFRGGAYDVPDWVFVIGVLLFCLGIFGAWWSPLLKVRNVWDDLALVKAGAAFVASLPASEVTIDRS